MAQDVTQLFVAGTAKVMKAPLATAAPADESAAWPAGWVDLGVTGENGLTLAVAVQRTDIFVHQLHDPARTLPTSRTITVGVQLEQFDADALLVAFPGSVITTVATTHRKFAFPDTAVDAQFELGVDVIDGAKIGRLIVPKVYVSNDVTVSFAKASESALPLEFRVLGTPGSAPAYILGDAGWLTPTP